LLVDGKWSSDPDGTIVKYEWRWGDGGAFGTTRRAWHVYARSGWYMLRLTVTDNRGATNTRAAWIYIPDAR
jgi:PKD repeat protein